MTGRHRKANTSMGIILFRLDRITDLVGIGIRDDDSTGEHIAQALVRMERAAKHERDYLMATMRDVNDKLDRVVADTRRVIALVQSNPTAAATQAEVDALAARLDDLASEEETAAPDAPTTPPDTAPTPTPAPSDGGTPPADAGTGTSGAAAGTGGVDPRTGLPVVDPNAPPIDPSTGLPYAP
jgi:hypothetical protein